MWRSIIGAIAVPYSRNHVFQFFKHNILGSLYTISIILPQIVAFFHDHRSRVSPVFGLDWLDPASSICFPLAIPLSTITKLTQVFHSTAGASSGYNHFDFCSNVWLRDCYWCYLNPIHFLMDTYLVHFRQIYGEQFKELVTQSELSNQDLGQIWALADVGNDGSLGLGEFIVAMFLIHRCEGGTDL